jgi:hypothetical protein
MCGRAPSILSQPLRLLLLYLLRPRLLLLLLLLLMAVRQYFLVITLLQRPVRPLNQLLQSPLVVILQSCHNRGMVHRKKRQPPRLILKQVTAQRRHGVQQSAHHPLTTLRFLL